MAFSGDRFTYVLYPVKNLRTGIMYTTIQAAINDVNTINGDTILVNSSTYRENVIVNKRLKPDR